MPQDPNSFLPQSALPIGQTPIDIKGVAVPTNIPNPLDVTNVFRMQQGIQGNIQLLQQVEQLKLQKQEFDLRSYEQMISDVDNVMGMTDNFVNNQNAQYKNGKQGQEPTDIFNGLDPNNTAHAAVIERLRPKMDEEQRRAEDIGIALIKSGSKDPAVRAEAIRGIKQSQANMQRIIQDDAEFKKYKKQAYNYELWHQQVTDPESPLRKNLKVDATAVAQLEEKYRKYVNGGKDKFDNPVVMRDEDFNVDQYFYDGDRVLKGIQDDSKIIAQGEKKQERVLRPDGSEYYVEKTVRPSREEAIALLKQKWGSDPDAIRMAKATGLSLDQLIANTYNVEHPTGTDEVISDVSPLIKAPETAATSPTGQVFKPMFGDSAGAEPLNEIQMDIEEGGFNPRVPDARMKIGVINNLMGLDDASLHPEIEYIQKDGSVSDFPDENTVSKRFVQRGTKVIEAEERDGKGRLTKKAVMGDKIIAEFPRIKAAATPTTSVDKGTIGAVGALKFNPSSTAQKAGPNMSSEDKIAAVESGGKYDAVNNAPEAVEGAIGKYQFLWNTHKKAIAEVTGISDKEAFKNSPDAQEKYFDYVNRNFYVPAIDHIQSSQDFPALAVDNDSLRYMLHYMGSEKAVTNFLKTGKFIIGGKDYTAGALQAFEMYSNKTNTDLIGSLQDHFAAEATTGGMHTITQGSKAATAPAASGIDW